MRAIFTVTFDDLCIILNQMDVPTEFLRPGHKGQISISCPLSPWFHEKKIDRRPSCSIKYSDDNSTLFKCWTCKESGKLSSLVESYGVLAKKPELRKLSAQLAVSDEPTLKAKLGTAFKSMVNLGVATKSGKPPILNKAILDGFFSAYSSSEGTIYLNGREVTKEEVLKFDLRWDMKNNRILFPVYDLDNELVGAVGRLLSGEGPRYYNYFKFAAGKCLGGLNLIDPNKSRLIIVEGFFDLMRASKWAHEIDADVVCSFHAELSDYQAVQIMSLGRSTSCWFDQDKAGEEGWEKSKRVLKRKVLSIRRARWEEDIDVGEMKREDFLKVYTQLKSTISA